MSNSKFRIAIFASGSGTNAEALFAYYKNHPAIEIGILLSNNTDAFALERAKKYNIPSKTFTKEAFQTSDLITGILKENKISHIVLAGFLWLVPQYLVNAFPNRIINIHPALLPKFGGKGMYGLNVHEAVRASGEKETGITIHLVNNNYDEGKILFQASCSVVEGYSAEKIQQCVQELEYAHYPRVIENWILGKPNQKTSA
jgi:phosphoribosylglycinamide formyltransferase 1